MAKTAKPIQHSAGEEKESKVHRPEAKPEAAGMDQEQGYPETSEPASSLSWLQHQVGNRAVQRLLTQRDGEGPFELDEEIASRIDHERSGGQPLEENSRDQMETALGQDFSGVKVHTTPEANTLNRQLGAEAFTTGQDIYFREGAYNPQSSEGQELLAHEMTHVVQQASGQVSSSGGMTVNAPGDALEQQADAVAQEVTSEDATGLQRQVVPEEEEEEAGVTAQREAAPEEEDELAGMTAQRQAIPEEEDEEKVTRKTLQRDALPEEEKETLQTQELEDEEEEMVRRRLDVQRQVAPEEEEVPTRRMEEGVAGPGQSIPAPAALEEAIPAQPALPVMTLPAETAPAPAPMAEAASAITLPAETAKAPAPLPEAAPALQAGPAPASAVAPPAATAQAPAPTPGAAPAPEAKAETPAAPAPTPAGGPATAGAEIEQIENAAAQQSEATRQELEQLYKF